MRFKQAGKRATKAKIRPRNTPGKMNQTESRYETQVLKVRLLAGEITGWHYEPAKYRYGKDFAATYTIDFQVFLANGEIEMIDVKGGGGWEPGSRVKMKACAEKYPQFHWIGETEVKGHRGKFAREVFTEK